MRLSPTGAILCLLEIDEPFLNSLSPPDETPTDANGTRERLGITRSPCVKRLHSHAKQLSEFRNVENIHLVAFLFMSSGYTVRLPTHRVNASYRFMANSCSYCNVRARHRIVIVYIHEPRSEGVTMTEDDKPSSRPERPDGYYELRRIVAANIRDQRQRRGWSLNRVAAGLAPYLGQMGASTISSWENSRTDGAKGFTIEEIFALCRVFEMTIAELLAAPRILDIGDPIERIAGEEPTIDIAKVFAGWHRDVEGNVVARSDDLMDSWRRYSLSIEHGPEEAPI